MRVLFIGSGDIGLPALQALLHSSRHQLVGVVTQPDKPAGRRQTLRAPPIKAALAGSALPILQPPRIRNPEAIEQIRALDPEVIVVIAYGQILPKAVLEIPRVACLNVHASLLPRHRGAAPIQAAIAAGDRETGLTIIYMDEGLDTGDMLLQTPLDIFHDTGGALHDRLAALAPAALLQALDQLSAGSAARIPQDPALASYAPKLGREAGKIDWNEPAAIIERKIRAFDPWPGAFTQLPRNDEARTLKIFRGTVVAGHAVPGARAGMVFRPDNQLVVATGRDALRLDDVQLEGKRRMSAAEFLRGFSSPITHF